MSDEAILAVNRRYAIAFVILSTAVILSEAKDLRHPGRETPRSG